MSKRFPRPIRWDALDDRARAALLKRPAVDASAEVARATRAIVTDVRRRGDAALRELTMRLDGVELESFEVPTATLADADTRIDARTRESLGAAIANIEAFHRVQAAPSVAVETTPGVYCERVTHPLDAVGFYVPAGSAPLPSTVLMLGVPARLAGCPVRILCTPPINADGGVDPTVLAAAKLAGVQRVFAIGGAQAIAAMAYGTGSVPRVAKIYGPGNQYVTAAKTLVAADPAGAAVDMPAGPSELLVIADSSADPSFVAADLLSQAEHGADSQVVLLTDCPALARAVAAELERQAASLPRRDIVAASLAAAALIVTANIDEAIAISNDYAPEHLIVNTREPRQLLAGLRNAGSVFLGALAPESVGDYCSGTNHVLPTYGWARSHSGLGLEDFRRSMTVQELTPAGLEAIGPHAVRLARAEGLDAHARAVQLRLSRGRAGAVA